MFNSYYGGYRTRTFADIFEDYEEFSSGYENSGINEGTKYELDAVQKAYYLLYARYGNSHIAYSDENQFKYALYSIIWQYGPTWAKRLEIQADLRDLDEDELVRGSKAIYNHAFNPNTEPSTATLEELTTINDQNTTNYKKSKLEAYGILWELLKTDVTNEFLNKFKKLFIVVTAPDYPLLYETNLEVD